MLMLHQRGRWEMKLSAPYICLAHPSIHLGQPAGRPAIHPAAAAAWKKKEAVYSLGEASHLKLLRRFSRGKRTAPTPPSFPRGGRLGCRGQTGEKKADLSWSASSTWFNTERLSYLQSQPGSALVYALNNSVILVSAGEHGRLSLHSGAITFRAQLCLCFTRSRCSSSCRGEQMQNCEFFSKVSCCSIFRQTDSR